MTELWGATYVFYASALLQAIDILLRWYKASKGGNAVDVRQDSQYRRKLMVRVSALLGVALVATGLTAWARADDAKPTIAIVPFANETGVTKPVDREVTTQNGEKIIVPGIDQYSWYAASQLHNVFSQSNPKLHLADAGRQEFQRTEYLRKRSLGDEKATEEFLESLKATMVIEGRIVGITVNPVQNVSIGDQGQQVKNVQVNLQISARNPGLGARAPVLGPVEAKAKAVDSISPKDGALKSDETLILQAIKEALEQMKKSDDFKRFVGELAKGSN